MPIETRLHVKAQHSRALRRKDQELAVLRTEKNQDQKPAAHSAGDGLRMASELR